MNRHLIRKISIALLASLLLYVSFPLISYAASYIKLVYDSVSGNIYGVIYSDRSSVNLSVYDGEGNPTDMTSELVGSANRAYQGAQYYYDVNGNIGANRSIGNITVTDDSVHELLPEWQGLKAVFARNNPLPAPILWSYTDLLNVGPDSAQVLLYWNRLTIPNLVEYRIYRDNQLIGSTSSNHYLYNAPLLSRVKNIGVSAVDSFGQESPISPMRQFYVPGYLNVGFSGKPSGYTLQRNDSLFTFRPDTNPALSPPDNAFTSLSFILKSAYKQENGGYTYQPYQIDLSELSASDFELVDSSGTTIPLDTFHVEPFVSSGTPGYSVYSFEFNYKTALDRTKNYTLRLSSTSSGDEIKLPDANTDKGNFILIVNSNAYESSYNTFRSGPVIIGDANPPAKPSGFSATAGDQAITIQWSPNTESDLAGYLVYLDGALMTPNPITATSYQLTGLTNGKTYHVNVAAVDKVGNRSLQAYAWPTPVAASGGGGGGGGGGDGAVGGGSSDAEATDPCLEPITAEQMKNDNGYVKLSVCEAIEQIDVPAVADALSGDSTLSLSNGPVTAELPAEVVKQLLALIDESERADARIVFDLSKLTSDELSQALSDAQKKLANTTLGAAGEAYDFTLSIRTKDGAEKKLTTFSQPVQLKLKLSDSADPNKTGLYYLGDNNKLEYVGGRIANGYLTAAVDHFSRYAAVEYSRQFDDLPSAHWSFQAVSNLASKHAIEGIDERNFAPSRNITRAEFASLLARVLELKNGSGSAFSDVANNAWYAEEVRAAAAAGIVSGSPDGRFLPNDKITRQEMTVMFMKAYELKNGKTQAAELSKPFADSERIAAWAAPYVNAAYGLRLVSGTGDGKFQPLGTATRAEAAVILSKLL